MQHLASQRAGQVSGEAIKMAVDTPIPGDLKATEKMFIGRRVLIVGDHPHANKTGTVDRLEYVGVLEKWGFVVKFDDGLSGFVFSGSNWQVLK